MEISIGVTPNCSEAVFRFYTLDPFTMQKILNAFATEVSQVYRKWRKRGEAVPEGWDEQEVPLYGTPIQYEGIALQSCAGLGDNGALVTVETDIGAFVLNIGNNDIKPDGLGCQTVRRLGVAVEEAESSPLLYHAYARDCTCGIHFFGDYEHLVIGGAMPIYDVKVAIHDNTWDDHDRYDTKTFQIAAPDPTEIHDDLEWKLMEYCQIPRSTNLWERISYRIVDIKRAQK